MIRLMQLQLKTTIWLDNQINMFLKLKETVNCIVLRYKLRQGATFQIMFYRILCPTQTLATQTLDIVDKLTMSSDT